MRQKRNHDEEMRWKQHHVNRNEKQYIRKKPNRLRNALKRKIAATDTNYMAPTILFQASGYQVRCIEDKCIRCGKCVEACPRHYLKMEAGKIQTDEFCAGCGLCLEACPQKALHVVRIGEVKEKLYDYFEKTGAEW